MNRLKYFVIITSLFPCVLFSVTAYSNIRLPQLVSDNMVLQRETEIKIWGWADPGEKVRIAFNGKEGKTITGVNGKWLIKLPGMKPGGPFTMLIKGNNQLTLNNILVGDVWFCSGQSNMVLNMERVKEKYPAEIENAAYPEIRNFFVPTKADVTKEADDLPPGKWVVTSPANVLEFGAATYFFAKQLYLKYHIPIGIINSSVGGMPIEAWVSREGLKDFSQYSSLIKNYRDTAYMNSLLKKDKMSDSLAAIEQRKNPLPPDKGMSGPKKWYDTTFVPEGWHKFWLPGYWADQGVKKLHGVVWFRKEIDVPASMTGVPAKLFVGRIVDADQTYVNGILVGGITYQYPPRRYSLATGLLKPGKNIIVVRVINNMGKGGFVPDKNYSLNANGQKIDLRGEWTYQVGQVQDDNAFNRESVRKGLEFNPQKSATGLYNAMVGPAINYTIKGFVWYQGETNVGRAKEYAETLPALINDWRDKWQQGEIPFLCVQLPNFGEVEYSPDESQWAELREAQLKALSLSNTAIVVTFDAGEWNDIHPLDKRDVGERLALAAENLAYGDKAVVPSGPLYQSYKIEGNKVIITFSNVGSGLMAKGGGDLYYFAIAGADKKYVWAKAVIDGDKVIVWNDAIANPISVRYAWADNPEGANLCNKEGLLASPFRTEEK